jgi:DNA-directed RNA polymerase specialized sigma54-like protein
MSDPKLTKMLVMTPQLQQAIRMLSMTQDELFAMVEEWRANHPGTLADLEPGEPDPLSPEEQAMADESGSPPWTYLTEPPLPPANPRPDVWVFGNPPQARANPAAVPRVKPIFDDESITRSAQDVREASWLARAIRQRARVMEKVVGQLAHAQPQLAVSIEPDKLEGVSVRDVAEAIGMHESTIKRIAPNTRYQTIHGVVQLVESKGKLKHRALW